MKEADAKECTLQHISKLQTGKTPIEPQDVYLGDRPVKKSEKRINKTISSFERWETSD